MAKALLSLLPEDATMHNPYAKKLVSFRCLCGVHLLYVICDCGVNITSKQRCMKYTQQTYHIMHMELGQSITIIND